MNVVIRLAGAWMLCAGLATVGCGSSSKTPAAVAPSGNGGSSGGGTMDGGVAVAVTPTTAHAVPGAKVSFTAKVTGIADMGVTWAVEEGAAGGSIDAMGQYTAPGQDGVYHVIATSQANSKATGIATVIVNKPSDCSALPKSGEWEAIFPPGITNTTAVAVDPFDQATVWLGGSHTGFYKSTDCGATWTHVNTGTNAKQVDGASLWSIAVDPVDRGTIYVVGGYGGLGLWKTTNGGVDFEQLFPPDSEYAKVQMYNFVNSVSMDPTNHLHLVITTHGTCSAPYDPNCNGETTDGGATWKLTKAPGAWEEGGGVFVLDAKSWLISSPFRGLELTEDNGATYKKLTIEGFTYGGNGQTSNRPFAKASDGAYYLSSVGGVLRSTDGRTWNAVRHDGRWVGFALSDENLYAADQWSPSFATASISDPSKWTKLPSPNGLAADAGAPFLDYDSQHHVLYASCFGGGVWRLVTP